MDQVKRLSIEIQRFDPGDMKFHIILLHNSINHLDEKACIKVHYDPEAIKTYKQIFQKLSDLSVKGAKLIIADCSKYNFFYLCKLKNPFAPDIEWHKHQPPEYWAKFLQKVGFCNPIIRWRSFDQLRSVGRFLSGNKVISYFLQSHFCLTMEKR